MRFFNMQYTFMKGLLVALFIAVLTLGLIMAFAPVKADAIGGGATIAHVNDGGYDPPMLMTCTTPHAKFNVYEHQSSYRYCDDVYSVYTFGGEHYKCYRGGKWVTMWNVKGWHRVIRNWNYLQCRMEKDRGIDV